MMNLAKENWKDYFFLLLLLLASLWQVIFLQATMKWDIMDITLPWNYHITECLQNGELPLWNPFINGGFAQMGINDTWNPITWLIGYAFGYDPIVIQFQYIGHLYLGGVGFYHLAKFLGWSRSTQLIYASVYMLSGFMIGNAQHLGWVVGASWLPWVFLYFQKWKNAPSIVRAISLAMVTALMFLGGYLGIFIGAVYLLLGLFIFRVILLYRSQDFLLLKKTVATAFASGATFLFLTLVAVVSMWRLSPHINRGDSLSLESALSGSVPWEAITTFLFPYASVAERTVWEVDWTLVNCYFGLIPFLFLPLIFFKKELSKKSLWYFLGGVLFLGISMGEDFPLRKWLYEYFPLMDIFRLPSYFRIFGIFFLLLASGFSFDYFFSKKNAPTIYKYLIGVGVLILGISLWAKNNVALDGGILIERNETWELLPAAKFYSHIGSQGLLHFMLLFSLVVGLIFLKKNKSRDALFLIVVSLDLFFAAQFNLTSTVIDPSNPKEVNAAFYQHSPEEYPLPPIDQPFKNLHRVANFDFVHLHINLNHFHKIPSPDGGSPVYFKWVDQAMQKGIYQKTIEYPLLFAANKINANNQVDFQSIDSLSFEKIKIEKFSPNQIAIQTDFSSPTHLIYLQNFHPDWKVFINEKEMEILRCNDIFLGIGIPEGEHSVKFVFDPRVEIGAFYISLVSWILVGLFFITIYFRRK